jgi:Family of unknown function (DUF5329)
MDLESPASARASRFGASAPKWLPRLVAPALLGLASMVQASDLSPAESGRIEYLLGTIAALPNAQFIRNGESFGARAAVAHMRLKLRLAGAHVKTAEDFIRYCATGSSLSGIPYEIRFSDGRIVPSAAFLREKLRQFDTGHAGATRPPT